MSLPILWGGMPPDSRHHMHASSPPAYPDRRDWTARRRPEARRKRVAQEGAPADPAGVPVRPRLRRNALVVLVATALPVAPTLAAEPDGVALADSCGTWVHMREGGSEGASGLGGLLERTKLCTDRMWQAAGDLKARLALPDRALRAQQLQKVRCEHDPSPVGPQQAARIGHRYLSHHPERLHLPPERLAWEALLRAFGCEEGPPGPE